jgi:hypothetical protein
MKRMRGRVRWSVIVLVAIAGGALDAQVPPASPPRGTPVVPSALPSRAPSPQSLAADFARALSYRAFLAADTTRAARWAAATERAPASVARVLRAVAPPTGTWRLLVVASHECTDSPEAVPYLANLAERLPGVELRVLRRADGLALLDSHLLNGHTATPLVLVLDSAFRERGVWLERAGHIQQYVLANEGKVPFDTLAAHVRAMRREDDGRSPLREVLALMREPRGP